MEIRIKIQNQEIKYNISTGFSLEENLFLANAIKQAYAILYNTRIDLKYENDEKIKNFAEAIFGNDDFSILRKNIEDIILKIRGGKLKFLKQKINMVISDNEDAYALKRAEKHGIKTYILKSNNMIDRDNEICDVIKDEKIDLILLLGYLKLIGPKTISKYTNNIVICIEIKSPIGKLAICFIFEIDTFPF